jgi:hypothetical protein
VSALATESAAPVSSRRNLSAAGPETGSVLSQFEGDAEPELRTRGSELAAVTEGLDGSERKLLLNHLATVYPEVVEAGFAWLAEYHAAVAERRRIASKEKYRERRRRQRAGKSRR